MPPARAAAGGTSPPKSLLVLRPRPVGAPTEHCAARSLRLGWSTMLGRLLCGAALLLVGGGLCSCFDAVEGQVDEQKNPYFIHGRERATARDYKGAIDAFEKALEVNPHSALAHFELGVLYEQHDEEEDHFISAVYHYKRALDLRPHAYPAGNAKERSAVGKRALVKAGSFAADYPLLEHELDKLK